MPTKRMIDPEFWQSESMAELSREERLFFIGLISNADDQGRLKAHPALLRSQIYPYDDDVTTDMITGWIEAISAVDSIFVYDSGGKTYIQIVKWWHYQSPQWAYPSKIPAPPGWLDRLKYRKNNKVIMENWDGEAGFIEAQEVDSDGYTHLPKALPKDKGKALVNRNSIALEIGIDSNSKELAEKSAKVPGPRTEISNHFLKSTGLPPPRKKPDKNYYWSEIAELEHIGARDPTIVNGWIDQIVPYMRQEGLSIHGPQSIKGFCRQLAAGQPLNGVENGRKGKRANSQGQRGTNAKTEGARYQSKTIRADQQANLVDV